MAFDFPSPATPGQIYAPPGGPVYRHDDDIWSTLDAGPPVIATPVMHTLLEFIDPALHADIIAGTSAVDVTAQCQAAAASGYDIYVPAGRYIVSDMITLQNGRTWQGAGRTRSIIYAPNTFNLSASGVFRLGTAEPGASLFDVGFEFQQNPAETVRANVVHYPPAILANVPRCQIDRVRISYAWDGINMAGNAGGSYVGRIEVGAFNIGLNISVATDFLHGESWHFWPFGFVSDVGLAGIYADGTTIAIQLGDTHGLNVDKISIYKGKFICSGPLNAVSTNIGRLQLDSNGARLVHSGGNTIINAVNSTKFTSPTEADIEVTGGRLSIGYLYRTDSSACPAVLVTGGSCSIRGGFLQQGNKDYPFASVGAGSLELRSAVLYPSAETRTVPYVEQTGTGVLRVKDCSNAVGIHTGPLVSYVSDNEAHEVSGNIFLARSLVVPGGAFLGCYGPNRIAPLAFTPTLTFTTPGDLAYTATTATGVIYREANGYRFFLRLAISGAITYTTAGGFARIGGLTVPNKGMDSLPLNVSRWSKVNTDAGYTDVGAGIANSQNVISLTQHGDNVALLGLAPANIPSGTTGFEITIDGFIPTI